ADRPDGSPPATISDNAFGAAVRIGDFELSQQRQAVPVKVALTAAKAQSTTEPAIAQHSPNRVAAFMYKVRHVESLITQPMAIACPGGGHHMIGDRCAVQVRFVYAKRGDIQPRRFYTSSHVELTAQQRGWLRLAGVLIPVRRDKPRRPILRM